jgi:hypothetical protein
MNLFKISTWIVPVQKTLKKNKISVIPIQLPNIIIKIDNSINKREKWSSEEKKEKYNDSEHYNKLKVFFLIKEKKNFFLLNL